MARDFTANVANYITIGDVAAIDITGTALSISCWGQIDVNNAYNTLVAKENSAGTGAQYALFVDNVGKTFVIIGDAAGAESATGATTVTTGGWHHFGLRKNGTGAGALQAFLDGVSDGSATSNKTIQNTAHALRFGSRVDQDLTCDGRIAEVGIWDVALADVEFAALAKGASPLRFRRDHLKGYWPLFGVAYPEPDLSGNGNNGTQNGTVGVANHAPVGRIAV